MKTRRERRQARRRTEEIASWILVPLILGAAWLIFTQVVKLREQDQSASNPQSIQQRTQR